MSIWYLDEVNSLIKAVNGEIEGHGYNISIDSDIFGAGEDESLTLTLVPKSYMNPKYSSNPEALLGFLKAVWGEPVSIMSRAAANRAPRVLIGEDAPVLAPPAPAPAPTSGFKHSLRYFRSGGDTIDVYIL